MIIIIIEQERLEVRTTQLPPVIFVTTTGTKRLRDWVGGTEATISVVFTDIVGSTSLGTELGDEAMRAVRHAHFERARGLIELHDGYEVKTIGDSFMVAFRTAVKALDFVLDLYDDTGHDRITTRAGIHVGPVHIEEEDAFGTMVNYTSRVLSMAKGAEVWVSTRAKADIDDENALRHRGLCWKKHCNCELRGFAGNIHSGRCHRHRNKHQRRQ